MRFLPHSLCLMSLRGRNTLHGRKLRSKEDALAQFRRITGQDFGYDADKWSTWLRENIYRASDEPATS
jgi:hypothetical protein